MGSQAKRMQWCEECNRRGIRKRLKLHQLNFKEAMWLCENSQCVYPLNLPSMKVKNFIVKQNFMTISRCQRALALAPPSSLSTDPASKVLEGPRQMYSKLVTDAGHLTKVSVSLTERMESTVEWLKTVCTRPPSGGPVISQPASPSCEQPARSTFNSVLSSTDMEMISHGQCPCDDKACLPCRPQASRCESTAQDVVTENAADIETSLRGQQETGRRIHSGKHSAFHTYDSQSMSSPKIAGSRDEARQTFTDNEVLLLNCTANGTAAPTAPVSLQKCSSEDALSKVPLESDLDPIQLQLEAGVEIVSNSVQVNDKESTSDKYRIKSTRQAKRSKSSANVVKEAKQPSELLALAARSPDKPASPSATETESSPRTDEGLELQWFSAGNLSWLCAVLNLIVHSTIISRCALALSDDFIVKTLVGAYQQVDVLIGRRKLAVASVDDVVVSEVAKMLSSATAATIAYVRSEDKDKEEEDEEEEDDLVENSLVKLLESHPSLERQLAHTSRWQFVCEKCGLKQSSRTQCVVHKIPGVLPKFLNRQPYFKCFCIKCGVPEQEMKMTFIGSPRCLLLGLGAGMDSCDPGHYTFRQNGIDYTLGAIVTRERSSCTTWIFQDGSWLKCNGRNLVAKRTTVADFSVAPSNVCLAVWDGNSSESADVNVGANSLADCRGAQEDGVSIAKPESLPRTFRKPEVHLLAKSAVPTYGRADGTGSAAGTPRSAASLESFLDEAYESCSDNSDLLNADGKQQQQQQRLPCVNYVGVPRPTAGPPAVETRSRDTLLTAVATSSANSFAPITCTRVARGRADYTRSAKGAAATVCRVPQPGKSASESVGHVQLNSSHSRQRLTCTPATASRSGGSSTCSSLSSHDSQGLSLPVSGRPNLRTQKSDGAAKKSSAQSVSSQAIAAVVSRANILTRGTKRTSSGSVSSSTRQACGSNNRREAKRQFPSFTVSPAASERSSSSDKDTVVQLLRRLQEKRVTRCEVASQPSSTLSSNLTFDENDKLNYMQLLKEKVIAKRMQNPSNTFQGYTPKAALNVKTPVGKPKRKRGQPPKGRSVTITPTQICGSGSLRKANSTQDDASCASTASLPSSYLPPFKKADSSIDDILTSTMDEDSSAADKGQIEKIMQELMDIPGLPDPDEGAQTKETNALTHHSTLASQSNESCTQAVGVDGSCDTGMAQLSQELADLMETDELGTVDYNSFSIEPTFLDGLL
ncbi:PREDICTED: uncharacterized protein LOC106815443 [Priapulus caudatus]|uniref:Uncharacterized protein LOC106815443 n=1 Tax=Priapulus caudatus TaxID=37621 RepID=A0ABM1ET63_PRICU|nr:PREDICTED: uncharacterized protein LOC106815443 [Priapulus caudatus]